MTIEINAKERLKTRQVQSTRVEGGARYDWCMVVVCAWLTGGVTADAWAHSNLPLESFFTPWHAVLYSGVTAVAIFTFGTLIRNLRRGYPVHLAIPAGYGLTLWGVIIAGLSGVGDMIWHILFGIEKNIDAALSPTHLGAIVGFTLIVAGPLRAAWQRTKQEEKSGSLSLWALLPMLLSLTFTFSMFTIMSQFTHPFVNLWPSYAAQTLDTQVIAVAGIVLQTLILMSFVLVAVRRWTLPFGAFTLVIGVNATLLSIMQEHYFLILVGLLAGLTTDLLYWRLKPAKIRPEALRIFAFAVPFAFYLYYFLALNLTTGINWTIHLWLGCTVVAGIAGCMLSYVLLPPQIPSDN